MALVRQALRCGRFWQAPGFLILALFVLCGCERKKETAGGPRAAMSPQQVDVLIARARPFQETVFATGTLRAREAVMLQAESAGVLREVRFEEGKAAAEGEVLFAIDDSELQAQLTRARARLDLAATFEKRDRELLQSGKLISESDYQQSLSNLEIARAEVALIEAQIRKTRVRAPFDGVAGLRRVGLGAFVTPGTDLGTFQDISTLKLDFSLPERYLPYLRTGQKTRFRVASHMGWLEATLYAIEPSVDVSTRSIQARALASNEDGSLLPGSFAEVEVALEDIPETILLPPIALVPGLKEHTVYTHEQGVARQRKVTIGLRTEDAVQITSGINPGDEVIISGVLQLRPGMKVQARRVLDQDASAEGALIGKSTGAEGVAPPASATLGGAAGGSSDTGAAL
jgi:membrane fusion protein (multidrug efflux system)